MYCPNCGKENTEKAKFCAHCGFEFKEQTEIEFAEESLQNPSNLNKNPKKKYRPFIGLILAISLLIVITVPIGIWFSKGTATSNNESEINERAYETYIDYDEKFLLVEETYLTDDGYVESDDIEALLDEVELIIQQGVSEKVIADYNREDDNIYVKFASGIQYIFMPYQEDVLSLGNGGQILTLEPNEDDISVNWQAIAAWIDALYNDIPFEDSLWPYANAQLIVDALPDLYTYDYALPGPYDIIDPLFGGNGSLRNSNVTVECMKQLGEYAIIIWEGHGVYNESVHSALVTGESFTGWAEFSKYKNELEEGSLVLTSFPTLGDTGVVYSPVRYYCITSTFVEKYIGKMDQSLLFLGACDSLKDNVLAQAFLDKGTSIVLGYTDEASMEYEMLSRSLFFYNLVQNSGATTVADAYQGTISMVGDDFVLENGNRLSYIAQDGIDSRYTLNGILKETITGTITGMAYTTEADGSLTALSDTTVTVTDSNGNTVGTAITSDLSGYTFILPAGTYTITVELDGYETVSKEISLAENDVLNVDFEMEEAQPAFTAEDAEIAYQTIIDEYIAACSVDSVDFMADQSAYLGMFSNVAESELRYYHSYGNFHFCYVYYDIDDNGVPELLIGTQHEASVTLVDAYAFDGNEAVKIVDSYTLGDRASLTVFTNGILYFYASGGASYGEAIYYCLDEDGYTLKPIVKYTEDYEKYPDTPYYNNDEKLTWNEFNAIYEQYTQIELSNLNWIIILPVINSTSTVEPSDKPNLREYFNMNIYDFATMMGGMDDIHSTDGIELTNGAITASAYYDDELIIFFAITSDCNYSIDGIEYGVSISDARKILDDYNGSFFDNDTDYCTFDFNDGSRISIYADANGYVDGIYIWLFI